MPSFRATAMFDSPLAQLRTMRDRNANPCALLRRAVQRSSVARSSALTLSSVFGRPVIHIPRLQLMSPDVCYIESLGRDTRLRLSGAETRHEHAHKPTYAEHDRSRTGPCFQAE